MGETSFFPLFSPPQKKKQEESLGSKSVFCRKILSCLCPVRVAESSPDTCKCEPLRNMNTLSYVADFNNLGTYKNQKLLKNQLLCGIYGQVVCHNMYQVAVAELMILYPNYFRTW